MLSGRIHVSERCFFSNSSEQTECYLKCWNVLMQWRADSENYPDSLHLRLSDSFGSNWFPLTRNYVYSAPRVICSMYIMKWARPVLCISDRRMALTMSAISLPYSHPGPLLVHGIAMAGHACRKAGWVHGPTVWGWGPGERQGAQSKTRELLFL